MSIAPKKQVKNLLSLVAKLRSENEHLRRQLEKKEPNWRELEENSLSSEERRMLLGR